MIISGILVVAIMTREGHNHRIFTKGREMAIGTGVCNNDHQLRLGSSLSSRRRSRPSKCRCIPAHLHCINPPCPLPRGKSGCCSCSLLSAGKKDACTPFLCKCREAGVRCTPPGVPYPQRYPIPGKCKGKIGGEQPWLHKEPLHQFSHRQIPSHHCPIWLGKRGRVKKKICHHLTFLNLGKGHWQGLIHPPSHEGPGGERGGG